MLGRRPMAYEPGTHFAYSSGVSELLAHIFHQQTGQDLEDYARNNLFEPLAIHEYHWKRSPLGEVDSEGGLFLPDYALAKLGELYRNLGMWHGVRLIGEDWVRDSVMPRADPGGGFRHGYQWWLAPYGDGARHAWSGLGFGGQYVFVMPVQLPRGRLSAAAHADGSGNVHVKHGTHRCVARPIMPACGLRHPRRIA